MIEVLQIIAYLVCVFISTYGVFAVAGILKEIKDTQLTVSYCIFLLYLLHASNIGISPLYT